ncbi:hypothetical protein ALO83_103340 [Pseudomonas cannabina pv. alisalensis]|uniref:Uncharacterized protein n=1 Tax=Pseudomonas cannabina TaxID=86840 RepID=A0A3M3R047_PSECA|nr:hypothetical protein ALO83_103340 [Pseudomonas cannabina pv. alisalensis]RMN75598.1 hypothetical protein ALQ52_103967 [Pseudomonas cannabina pv. alisalensis]RMN84135.1 hypothetical protein ALQ53_103132 [Pseudomonas cannabina]RMN89740.1 hypothetical protein ALQ51_101905 [Pseudomonas cannabina]
MLASGVIIQASVMHVLQVLSSVFMRQQAMRSDSRFCSINEMFALQRRK